MPAVLVNHRVADYAKWLKAYEEHEPERRKATITSSTVWRDAEDPNHVYMLFECQDLEKVRQLGSTPEMRETARRAGVIGEPTSVFLNEGAKYPRQAGQRA